MKSFSKVKIMPKCACQLLAYKSVSSLFITSNFLKRCIEQQHHDQVSACLPGKLLM